MNPAHGSRVREPTHMKDVIDFDAIEKYGPQQYAGHFDLPTVDIDRIEIANGGTIDIALKAEKGNLPGEYIADGTANFSFDMTCSRCTDPYPFANSSAFHVRFRPRPEALGEEEVEISDTEELDVEFYSERIVPLRDLAIEQIQLSIPMKPLCDDGCLGLCSRCGASLAREKCSCEESVVDQRWDSLRGIREQLAKKKDI